ncbi:MAG: adenylyl-sulfate kinase [Chitinophagaceae bacterium]|nr:MAG: adenylyl-sulfate kinase [Chitinophagaceae bacterium]
MLLLQFTGLSGAGKSTLAQKLQGDLVSRGIAATVIDGDVYRKTLCKDLGFSAADRKENMRRLASIANDYRLQGIIAIIAAINPFEESRQEIKEQSGALTIWIHCPLPILFERDPKGLYRKALLPDDDPQKIFNLTGVSDPYDEPKDADLVIDTSKTSVDEASRQLLSFVLTTLNVPLH